MSQVTWCLLIDTGIVFELFRRDAWSKLFAHYNNVILAQEVVAESKFYLDDQGQKKAIDLSGWISKGTIKVVSAPPGDLITFSGKFDNTYIERFDPGELEIMTYWNSLQGNEGLICSADSIVFKTLGRLNKKDCGVSLEEILDKIGHSKKELKPKFTKKFREDHSVAGLQDFIYNFKS